MLIGRLSSTIAELPPGARLERRPQRGRAAGDASPGSRSRARGPACPCPVVLSVLRGHRRRPFCSVAVRTVSSVAPRCSAPVRGPWSPSASAGGGFPYLGVGEQASAEPAGACRRPTVYGSHAPAARRPCRPSARAVPVPPRQLRRDRRRAARRGVQDEQAVDRARAGPRAPPSPCRRRARAARGRRPAPGCSSRSSARHTSTDADLRPAVLADVLEQLGDGEVRDALDGRGRAAPAGRPSPSPAPCSGRRPTDSAASSPRSVRTAGWMPRARSRSSWSASFTSPCASSTIAAAVVGVLQQLLLGQAEPHREGDQPGLRPVVQIALDAPQVGRGRVDDDPPVRLQLGDPPLQLVGGRQQPAHHRPVRVGQPPRDERQHRPQHEQRASASR